MPKLSGPALVSSGVLGLGLLIGSPAFGAPQYNTGLLAGVGGRGVGSEIWSDTVFYGGLRGDVILGRTAPRDFGAGPYVMMSTAGFGDVRLAGGGSLLLPVHDAFPLLLSAGPLARVGDGEVKPGVQTQLFFGGRSYNYHADYSLAAGLVVGLDYSFAERDESVIVLAAQLDGFLLALPFLILGRAL